MATSDRFVALLRGVNVGQHRRVAMPQLRALVEQLGHTEVATHLNSGNVVLTAADDAGPASGRAERIARGIEAAIESELGLEVDVVVRARKDLAAVVRHDPLGSVATDPSRYFVTFLSSAPDPAGIAAIDADRFAPERFAVRGREVFVWMPGGIRNAPLMAALGKVGPPGVVATTRNWNTVTRLLELLDER